MDQFYVIWGSSKREWILLSREEFMQRLGLCDMIAKDNVLETRINDLEELIMEDILIPRQKKVIIEFLRRHPNTPTRRMRKWQYGKWDEAWNKAMEQLEKEGIIESVSHGRGRNRTWHVKGV